MTERWEGHAHPRGTLFVWLFAFLSGFEVRSEEVSGLSIPLPQAPGIAPGAGEAHLQA